MGTFVYLHGFESGPSSAKARETAAFLARDGRGASLQCPQLPVHPAEAFALLEGLCAPLPPDSVLIGSSLGGFYATWAAERFDLRAVLINPAVRPFDRLAELAGERVHPYTGEHYHLDMDDMNALRDRFVPRPDPRRYWLVLGTADETLDWREAARHYAGARQTLFNGDDHRLNRWPECLPFLSDFAA